jgi:hypothetical protein
LVLLVVQFLYFISQKWNSLRLNQTWMT